MMRAIKIDPSNKSIEEIELAVDPNRSLSELRSTIGFDQLARTPLDRNINLLSEDCNEEKTNLSKSKKLVNQWIELPLDSDINVADLIILSRESVTDIMLERRGGVDPLPKQVIIREQIVELEQMFDKYCCIKEWNHYNLCKGRRNTMIISGKLDSFATSIICVIEKKKNTRFAFAYVRYNNKRHVTEYPIWRFRRG